ncbi:UDP-N-acetylglucosamine transporter TMEM241 homolog isoform X1 [Hoplias malabaricus]|uniref:UDP-N-acetylglucosamine transporter TMEM241 homolog isoform X1 n=1 Tax=Hoplias malabaricus TaxID=27720 RepID=UPI003462EDBA
MNLVRLSPGLIFCLFFVVSHFTNKYVLSVLKFTFPTIFLGWQTSTGALLLYVTGKFGWVEINGFTRSAALLWLPGSIFFLGNIYAGSKALAILPIPFFFVIQNLSELVFFLIVRLTQREPSSWMKILRSSWFRTLQSDHPAKSLQATSIDSYQTLMLMSAVTLIMHNLQFGPNGYIWVSIHLFCFGSYRVFQRSSKSNHLSDLEQQLINYMISTFLLVSAAHPTGDVFGALEFPFLMSYKFHSGCFASGLLGFLLLLASVKMKSGQTPLQCAIWVLMAKIMASGLSVFVFITELSPLTVYCILTNHAGEALSIYSDKIQR